MHRLLTKQQKGKNFSNSTAVLRVSEVKVVMYRYVPAIWCINGTTDQQKQISSYYVNHSSDLWVPPKAGELVVADIITMKDLAGEFSEIVNLKNLSTL